MTRHNIGILQVEAYAIAAMVAQSNLGEDMSASCVLQKVILQDIIVVPKQVAGLELAYIPHFCV